ncbi:2-oxo acid dehydrogenase subunit E2 [Sphingobium algorifonticola]|uniref:Dihydrolipoamide acetyltransferase component of pyruvate dehydrogenase complex n=1 Tax=Sphingobium algorifonticola TaxID=2008318 RepID=A0A437JCF5_9SPHN|nr:2-oxo acid dehydrogenase subunit E2 [Sphingobium algorifonticola]RVT43544.1 2-oxo acid dehydrogenase subunit E2 [Sphingobium algorifonticola]
MADLKAFTMPKWGIEMAEGTIAEWMVAEGAPFAKGTVLTLIETDKITNEVEAEADGCFVRLIAQAGETHPVGALLAVLGAVDTPVAEVDAFVAQFRAVDTAMPGVETSASATAPVAAVPSPVTIPDDTAISPVARSIAQAQGVDVSAISGSGRKGRITRQDIDLYLRGQTPPVLKGPIDAPGQESAFASPLARRLAVQMGVDLSIVKGSGHRGRITKADVLAKAPAPAPVAADAAPPVPATSTDDVEMIPMSAMRKAIAARLTQAKQEIPHFYLRRRVRADRLIALRMLQGKVASLNDYLLRAVALALREVPEVNIQVHGTVVHRFAHADIAVAVSTPRGLITPIVRHADAMDVRAIADRMGELAQRARAGKLAAEEFQGGSFSVSNLGMFGVEQFDAIINPPQGAILAVGKARPEPIDDDGAIRIVPVLHLSLSCDHRAIDGADGARFLGALAELLENPERL